jgi:hypothetical protein
MTFLTDVLAYKPNLITLERIAIERGNVAECAAQLRSLLATRGNVLENNGTVSFAISGYESDSRQPFEIEEVRRYFQRLDDHEPQWFHLCNRTDDTLRLLFMSTARVLAAPAIGACVIGHTFDRNQLKSFLMRHYHAMKGLHEEFEVPQSTSENISGLVISYFKTVAANSDIALQ